MSLPYLAINAYASFEKHVVGTLDFRCPTHQTGEYPDGSVGVHHDAFQTLVDSFLAKMIVVLDNMLLVDSIAERRSLFPNTESSAIPCQSLKNKRKYSTC
jgi:hypothetical protein